MITFSLSNYRPLLLAVTLVNLASCSSGGSDSASLAEVSAESVSTAMTAITDTVTSCSTEDAAVSATAVASQTSSVVSGVIAASRAVSDDSSSVTAMADIVGSCDSAPGLVSVSSEHASGTTVYTLEFNDYCIAGTEGDTIYDGSVESSENGEPSDSGPVVSSLDVTAKSLMVMPSGASGDQLSVSFESHTEYGTEYISFWGPSTVPDSDNPDVSTISSVVIENTTDGSVHKIDDLDIVRTGSISSASVQITGGSYTNPDGERVDIATPDGEAITINGVTGTFVDGNIELTGAGDTGVVIGASSDRTVTITVNGTSADSLNCSGTDTAVTTTADLVVDELKVY